MNNIEYAELNDRKTPKEKKWPVDVLALAILTGALWAITFGWYAFDLDHQLSSVLTDPLQSESNVWLLAISGLIIVYFILAAIIAAWIFIVGIPTCLLAVNLGLRHYKTLHRWLISGAFTVALFVALSHYGIVRYDLGATAAAKKPTTLSDLDQSQPLVPENELSQEEAIAAAVAMEKATQKTAEEVARVRCADPKDPFLISACARLNEPDQWQQDAEQARE